MPSQTSKDKQWKAALNSKIVSIFEHIFRLQWFYEQHICPPTSFSLKRFWVLAAPHDARLVKLFYPILVYISLLKVCNNEPRKLWTTKAIKMGELEENVKRFCCFSKRKESFHRTNSAARSLGLSRAPRKVYISIYCQQKLCKLLF